MCYLSLVYISLLFIMLVCAKFVIIWQFPVTLKSFLSNKLYLYLVKYMQPPAGANVG